MKIDKKIKEDLRKYLDELLTRQKENVTVFSAYPLEEKELALLYNSVPRLRKSNINFVIDNKILAGIVIKVGSKVIDLTINERLNNLRQQIYEID